MRSFSLSGNTYSMCADVQDMHIGEALRAKREGHELTLEDVSELLHIQPAYISAMETLDIAALPSLGYVLGFVRSYAKLLGMNPKTATARYKVESQIPSDLGIGSLPHHVIIRRIKWPRGMMSALCVVMFAGGFATWLGLHSLSTVPDAPITEYVDLHGETLDPVKALSTDPDVMTIKAVAPSWVEVLDGSDKIVFSRIMVKDDIFELAARPGLRLSARDGGAIEMYQGGVKLGMAGAKGEIVSDVDFAAQAQKNIALNGVHAIVPESLNRH